MTILTNLFGDHRIHRITGPYADLANTATALMHAEVTTFSCLAGHLPRYVWEPYRDKIRLFTMLRDPVERVFSLYRFLRMASPAALAEIGLRPAFTFDDFLSSKAPGIYAQVNNGMTRMLSNDAGLHDPDDASFWQPTSLQEALPTAVNFLAQIDFGLVEQMQETLDLMQQEWNVFPSIEEYKENKTDPDTDCYTVENIHRVVCHNIVDISLFKIAQTLFEARVKNRVPRHPALSIDGLWQGALGPPTSIDRIPYRQGFYPIEKSGLAWMMIDVAPQIHFMPHTALIENCTWIRLYFYKISFLYRVDLVKILINDVPVSFTMEQEGSWCTLTIGPLFLENTIHRLTIKQPYAVPVYVFEPDSKDRRMLGLALSSVEFVDRVAED